MRRHRSAPLAVGLALLTAACSAESRNPVAPLAEAQPIDAAPLLARGGGAGGAARDNLLACPLSRAESGSAVIGERGGTLTVAGHGLFVPPGAVRKATRFILTVPRSDVLQVDISAEGQSNFAFRTLVLVRLSYARCASVPKSLVGWWIDGGTRGKLGEMPSVDDRLTRSLWITTDHLSGYAIAYRGGGSGEAEGQGEGR